MKSTFKALTNCSNDINAAWSHLEEAHAYTRTHTQYTVHIVQSICNVYEEVEEILKSQGREKTLTFRN